MEVKASVGDLRDKWWSDKLMREGQWGVGRRRHSSWQRKQNEKSGTEEGAQIPRGQERHTEKGMYLDLYKN